jgi:hypothetical protein
MAPPPSSSLPLQERLLQLAQTLQCKSAQSQPFEDTFSDINIQSLGLSGMCECFPAVSAHLQLLCLSLELGSQWSGVQIELTPPPLFTTYVGEN